MRLIPNDARSGRLVFLIAGILLVAACTDGGNDVRSPAPTGSLTPASSAEAPASPSGGGYLRGRDASEAPRVGQVLTQR